MIKPSLHPKRPLWALAGILLLASCTPQDELFDESSHRTPVTFTASNAPLTRTTNGGSDWASGDAIGIFMLPTGGTLPSTTGDNNVQYTATPDAGDATKATFAPVNTSDTIYYLQPRNADFIAYYPWRTTPATDPYIYKVSVATQTNPANIDVLYAKTINVAKSKTAPVELTFRHLLAKITLDVKAGTGFANSDIANLPANKITIGEMPASAKIDLQNGTLTSGSTGPFSPLKASTPGTGAQATFTAILVPQAASAYTTRKIEFAIGNETYTWNIPAATYFEEGKHYTYTVTVNKTGITASTGAITDWNSTGTSTPDASGQIMKGIEMVFIPRGTFLMGSPDGVGYADERPQHWVRLTQDFYMSKYQITFDQYDAFCEATGRLKPGESGWGRGKRPVINVSWYDAKAFADWVGGSLPTEAQWEYACRAGTTTEWATESGTDSDLPDYAWYVSNSGSQTQPVGGKKPNPWGLYDMHGNVFEWCMDQWDGNSNYQSAPNESDAIEDPLVTSGSHRVLRGGSWINYAQHCRSAYRSLIAPGYANYNIGFRVVFVP